MVEAPWAPGGLVRAPTGALMHRHCIVGSRFAPKVGCHCSTCEDLVLKAVARSVDGPQVDDNGPMDPWRMNLVHCLNQHEIDVCEAV